MKHLVIDLEKLPRYCVVCGHEYGSELDRHCTPNSVVVVLREGVFKKRTRYFTCDGIELSEADLARLREEETARMSETGVSHGSWAM